MVVYTSCEPSGFTSRFSTTSVVGDIAKFSQGSDFLNTIFIEVISGDDAIENDVIKPGDTVEIDGKVYNSEYIKKHWSELNIFMQQKKDMECLDILEGDND